MDSPTRDLLNTLDNAGKSLEIMEEHQREYERNLEEFDANMREGGSDFLNSGATGQVDLKKLIAHHKGKALNQEQPTHIQPGVGILHGTIIGAKGLVASDGTCDPFVKVSYVPPGDVSTSLMFRAKMTVHTTGIADQTTEPTWDDGAFSFEVDAPPAQDGVPMHIESDWSRLQGDLLFTVYDCNRGTRNERIGQFIFPLRTLIDGKTPSTVQGGSQKIHDQWFALDRKGKPSMAKLRVQMTLVLPNTVQNTDDQVFSSDDLTNADYKKPKENYADAFRNALEENDSSSSSSDEGKNEEDILKENIELEKKQKAAATKKKRMQRKKKKVKIDRGAERRERERKRIAKENLILQKRMSKARTNGSGTRFKQGKNTKKSFAADKRTARERLRKRIEEDDKILKQRIDKVRGKPKVKKSDEEVKKMVEKREAAAAAEAEAAAKKQKDSRDALFYQLENANAEIRDLEEETTLIKSKAQRLEVLTRKNNARIDEARELKKNREKALTREKKKRVSSLPNGAKSAYSSFPGAKESEFTKLQREYDNRNNNNTFNGEELGSGNSFEREKELKELRITLRAALHKYEERQQIRRQFADQAKAHRQNYNTLARKIMEADSKLKEIANRRKHRMKKAAKKSKKRRTKAKMKEALQRLEESGGAKNGEDMAKLEELMEENDDMYDEKDDDDAKQMSYEEQQRIEEIHKINKEEAKSRIELKAILGEMEEMKFSHNLRKQENAVEIMELQTTIDEKNETLQKSRSELNDLKKELKQLTTDGTIEKLESEIRDLEYIYGLVSASIRVDFEPTSNDSNEANLDTIDEGKMNEDVEEEGNKFDDEGKNSIDEDQFPMK